MNPAAQTDRHRDWEKRILAARKAGFDVGSLSVRVLEQWYRTGWYEMFYNRCVCCLSYIVYILT